MNVLLVDPLKHQDKPHSASLEQKVNIAMTGVRSSIELLMDLSGDPKAREFIKTNMSDVYSAQLALCIVAERVQPKRSVA